MIRRGLYNPATAEYAKQLRGRLHEAWRSVAGEATQHSAEWCAVIDAQDIAHEATRQSCGGSLTQMQEWLIFTPANLKETNWEFLSAALEDARQ